MNSTTSVARLLRGTVTVGALVVAALLVADPAAARWPTRGGGIAGVDQATDIVTAPSGAVYVVGFFKGTATFGRSDELSLTSDSGSEDMYVLKLSNGGSPLWAVAAGGASADRGLAIAVDASENVYVTGYYHGTAYFGGASLTAPDSHADAFVAKLSEDGDWRWARAATGSWDQKGTAIAFIPGNDSAIPPVPGSVLVSGRYTCSTTFGTAATLNNTNCSAGGAPDVFVARLDPDGNWKWAVDRGNGAAGSEEGKALAASSQGALYLVGQGSETVTVLTESFQSSLGSWSASGLWHRSSSCAAPTGSMHHSTPFAAYFGIDATCTFNNGTTVSGLLESATVDLTAHVAPVNLSFKYFLQTEDSSHYDAAWVEVWDSAQGWRTLDTKSKSGGGLGEGAWRSASYDISSYAGKQLKIRFGFNSRDSLYNDYQGFYVDDVSVTAARPFSFLARLANVTGDTAGTWAWLREAPANIVFNDVAVDPSSSNLVVVAANATGAADFPGTANEDVTGAGAVAAQAQSSSTDAFWQWAKRVPGAYGNGVTADDDGNVYLVGNFAGSTTFAGSTISSTGGSHDIYVASLTAAGVPRWVTGGSAYDTVDGVPGKAGGAGTDLGLAISTDGVANLHVAGRFQKEAFFGQDESVVVAAGAQHASDVDALVADLNLDGKWFEIDFWTVGEEVPPPPGALYDTATMQPEFRVNGAAFNALERYFLWNQQADGTFRLYSVQPVDEIEIHWRTNPDVTDPSRIVAIGGADWPADPCTDTLATACYQVHVATSPVEIDPAGGGFKYYKTYLPDVGSNGGTVTNNVFSTTGPGLSVVVYKVGVADAGQIADLDLQVVKSFAAVNTPGYVPAASCEIGTKLTDVDHDEVGRSGRVLNANAFYDASIYSRDARTGPIVPVNRISSTRSQDAAKQMTVVWYKRDFRGVYWGRKPVTYDCRWPLDPEKIIVASQQGTEVLGQEPLDPLRYASLQVYNQPYVNLPGFNPNDEHALIAPSTTGSGYDAVFALRSDFGNGLASDSSAASDPYVLVKYWDSTAAEWAFKVFNVIATGAGFDNFHFNGTAGTTVSPPYPVRLLPPCEESTIAGETDSYLPAPFYRDYTGQLWSRCAGDGVVYYHYPLQAGFFYDLNNDDVSDTGTGSCVPWLARLPASLGGTADPTEPIAVGYTVDWPASVPLLLVGETLMEPKRGLPDITNQPAVAVAYDALTERLLTEGTYDPQQTLVRLIDPTTANSVTLTSSSAPTTPDYATCYNMAGLPDDLATETDETGAKQITGSADGTVKLPFAIYSRLSYDDLTRSLSWEGTYDDSGAGEPLLLLNVMTGTERDALKAISGDADWDVCVDTLYKLSRNPNLVDLADTFSCWVDYLELTLPWGTLRIPYPVCDDIPDGVPNDELLIGFVDEDGNGMPEPLSGVGGGMALTAGFAQESGYVTLAFNDDPSLTPLPISLNIIRVGCLDDPGPPPILSSYQGEIKVIEPENIFDEQITLRFSGDFAGNSDALEFEWYSHPDADGTPPFPLPDPENGQLNGWLQFPVSNPFGANQITIGGANIQTLSDNWYVMRYRGLADECDTLTGWSLWAGQPGATPLSPRAQLAEGWVKRVVRRLNPFEARVQAFHTSATNTYGSMLVQLGERYEGDIAFSNDPDYLNAIGLIEAYETVLRRAMMLSVDSTPPIDYGPANAAILLVASRIQDFYTLLGNEAYADAADPTVGISTDSVQYGFGSLAPTIFCFENQVASLLEEEQVLLRGRDDSQGPVAARPVYNRLFWNFTSGMGEVAYALSYNISDQDVDGDLDEYDSRILFPQGHGDAWGHYLTAMTKYYQLLRHPFFTWQPRPEAVLVAGVPIQVDYFDERNFAETAAAKAKAGAEVVDLTYRANYVEDPAGQWQGYKDTDPDRAWGVAEWGHRAGLGAYLDWVVGNAILPAEDPNPDHFGIQKIDRTTVDELDEIAAQYVAIQTELDQADRGLNPLGLAKGVVPFDIDPSRVDQGETHFEQVFERATQALENAVTVWDFANQVNRMLRNNQDTVDDLYDNTTDREIDFNSRLIEAFGSPYDADIGGSGLYPDGYTGPDLYHFWMVDAPALAGADIHCDPSDTADPCNDPASPLYLGYHTERFTAAYNPMDNGVNFFNIHSADAPLCPSNDDDCLCSDDAGPACGAGLDCANNPFDEACTLGDPPDTSISVEYWTWDPPDAGFYFVKDPSWPPDTQRRTTGAIQDALYEIINAELDLQVAFKEHDNLMHDIIDKRDTLLATFNINEEKLKISNAERKETNDFLASIATMQALGITLKRISAGISETFTVAADECVPDQLIFGLAGGGSVLQPVKCGLKTGEKVATFILDTAADAAEIVQNSLEAAKEDVSLQAAIETSIQDARLEIFNLKGDLDALVRQEPLKRADMEAKAEALAQAHRKYLSALSAGYRDLSELIRFRKSTASQVQEYRYQDMAFRIFRNDALQKYRAAFDMAARYAYLAAAAYDYETNLLGTDAEAGQGFLTDIVRERAIGQVFNHEPVPGSRGLADPIGRMEQNFAILKGQMGFNNPQSETNRFSLRSEMLRIDSADEGDADWRRVLAEHRVDDLWQVPEFRRYVRPFAPESQGPQPGLVIPFSTTVTFGLNFFGWPLGPGDSAYDPTHFATRVRGVGVWFADYAGLPLSNTPRVYLVPAGADVLRSPSATDFTTREWTVVDQILPVPFPIGEQALQEPAWTPIEDMLSGPFGEIRRFSSFRAYHYAEPFDDSQIVSDSRLIGRSVWNTRWLLIIPGGTLLFDPEAGIDTFVDGQLIPGTDERDGNGVSDIKIFFQTYAYSGN